MSTQSEIKKTVTKGEVKLERIFENSYQSEGTMTAELKQTVTTHTSYPSKTVSDDLNDNVFDAVEDFGFATQDYSNTSTRVAWIEVPKSFSEEKVREVIFSHDVCLQQIMSNQPILTTKQKYAISVGLTNLDAIADRQALRYPDNSDNAGKLILDRNSGKPIYRVNTFKKTQVEDVDLRDLDPENVYYTEKMREELAMEKELADASEELFNG